MPRSWLPKLDWLSKAMWEMESVLVSAMVIVGAGSPWAIRSGSSAGRVVSGERERKTLVKVAIE